MGRPRPGWRSEEPAGHRESHKSLRSPGGHQLLGRLQSSRVASFQSGQTEDLFRFAPSPQRAPAQKRAQSCSSKGSVAPRALRSKCQWEPHVGAHPANRPEGQLLVSVCTRLSPSFVLLTPPSNTPQRTASTGVPVRSSGACPVSSGQAGGCSSVHSRSSCRSHPAVCGFPG